MLSPKKIIIFISIFVLFTNLSNASGKLTSIAVSNDGKTVLTGGDNCALFVIDADTLKVKNRIWIGKPVKFVSFNKDNSKIVVFDSSAGLNIFDANNYRKLSTQSLPRIAVLLEWKMIS